MVEAATETVKVKLIDGKDAEVRLKIYMNAKERQRLEKVLLEGIKVKKGMKMDDFELPAERVAALINTAAEIIWADKNYTLDDVESESIGEVVSARLEGFLKNYGLTARAGNSQGG